MGTEGKDGKDGNDTVVIVGAGLAGAKAAETLREEGFTGSIVLIGAEDEPPYERPPLSKDYLLGNADRASTAVHDPGWYTGNDVELLLGTAAVDIHRDTRDVELADGRRVRYTHLLLATGASPRRLSVPGSELDGVHYLRELSDSERLRDALRAGGPVAVIGAGWIGLEVAAAARQYGCEVTVIEPQDAPLLATLGPELGGYFADVHRRHGVRILTGRRPNALIGSGMVVGISTDAGEEIEAGTVVVGIGAKPNTALARGGGLTVDNGIVVDEYLRTADPTIAAAGDVASAFHPFYERHVRVEHWAGALNAGPAAARSLIGRGRPYDELPFFYTDQYDIGMEFIGLLEPGRPYTVVTRGAREDDAFHAFWLADDQVVAGLHVNMWDDGIEPAKQLIRSRAAVDPARLADPSVPLGDVVR
ncbi:FAD-dependent oxidoreductase [Saccharomonospora xinjiangensis]|uniref:NAD(P)/FAD-dependent oxidoreductase n=1 Tax=Saccharomonospora xinjiangensis TaxID=75294 RepID=UPI00106F9983|nr:FAD-dependent oxidoreductase [Saccharomonospora xinjiangensis]QBQ59960.1 Rhodocoxin reductase [Saccharomonospora xinjiangensis]